MDSIALPIRRRTEAEKDVYWALRLADLMAELRQRDRLILALADRVHKQSELLGRRAEKK